MGGINFSVFISLTVLLVAIVFAAEADPGLATFLAILEDPNGWPFVITLDLLVGVLFFSCIIFLIEGDMTRTLYWAVPLFFLGNIVSAAYLLINLEKIRERVSPSA